MGDGLNDIFDILLFFDNVSFFDIFTSLERLLKSISPGTINNCSIGSMHIFIFILVLKLSTFHKTVQFSEFIKIGDNEIRHRVANEYKNKLSDAKFPSLIHNSSVIGIATKISDGTVIMPQTNIGPNSSIGNFCIVNSGSSIDHDCKLGDFSSIAPGVFTGGNVTIGVRSAISIGTIVKQGISIGEDVVIGAKSYVDKDLDDCIIAYGIPCVKIRSRNRGESYLT